MIAIERKDTNVWAIPGGMVDPGEKISATLKREFMEEALNSLSATETSLTDSKIVKYNLIYCDFYFSNCVLLIFSYRYNKKS